MGRSLRQGPEQGGVGGHTERRVEEHHPSDLVRVGDGNETTELKSGCQSYRRFPPNAASVSTALRCLIALEFNHENTPNKMHQTEMAVNTIRRDSRNRIVLPNKSLRRLRAYRDICFDEKVSQIILLIEHAPLILG